MDTSKNSEIASSFINIHVIIFMTKHSVFVKSSYNKLKGQIVISDFRRLGRLNGSYNIK